MKKLMMMAVAVLFAASANAQGDIVKLIKKAKTYSDAMQLVNQGVSALSNEDKAKVYTKVCDLAAKEFSTEQDNYIKKDLNPGGYDVNNAYTAAQNLIKSALSLRDADPKAAIKYICLMQVRKVLILRTTIRFCLILDFLLMPLLCYMTAMFIRTPKYHRLLISRQWAHRN